MSTDDKILKALEGTKDLVYIWDLASDSVEWIGSTKGLVENENGQVIQGGHEFQARINPQDLHARLAALSNHYSERSTYDCEYRFRCFDGSFKWVHDRGRAEFNEDGMPVRIHGILRRINRRRGHQAQLEHAANYDSLTGQYNRTRLFDFLGRSISSSARYGGQGCYICVELQRMDQIGRQNGNETVDAILISAAQRLSSIVRASDVLGRVGPNRFGVLLENCDQDKMNLVAEKIIRRFSENEFNTPNGSHSVCVSMGGIQFPDCLATAYEAMSKAEIALAMAREKGENKLVTFEITDSQRQEFEKASGTVDKIRQALNEDRLCFAYQPIITTQKTKPAFYECLLRLKNEDGSITPAGEFIMSAERLGMNREIDHAVLNLAFKELQTYPDISLSINVSGYTTSDPSWLVRAMALFHHHKAMASRLIVELTETAAFRDLEETARFVSTLHQIGCRVALDDCGAGHISPFHIKTLDVDIIKIDGSFIRNIHKKPEQLPFVRNIVDLANRFGLSTVAECVEYKEEFECLKKEKVEYLQGYFFEKPTLDPPWHDQSPEPVGKVSETG